MNVLCISASNMANQALPDSTSVKICKIIMECLSEELHCGEIIDLRTRQLQPCMGCGQCYGTHRCVCDSAFNLIYEKIIHSDRVFIVSPHYAPIPAKLCMILEKMEQITFLHWAKDNRYQSEVYGIPTGIISHGGGSDWALSSYKAMVNDTIANALDTIQMRVIPFSEEWDTGISLPVKTAVNRPDEIFPKQEYDWVNLREKIEKYLSRFPKDALTDH